MTLHETAGRLMYPETRHDEFHLLLEVIKLHRLAAVISSAGEAAAKEAGGSEGAAELGRTLAEARLHEDLENLQERIAALTILVGGADGMSRLISRWELFHKDMNLHDEQKAEARKEQVQLTLDRDEVLMLVVYDSLAAATAVAGGSPKAKKRVRDQLLMKAHEVGVAALSSLRRKLHAALKAVEPSFEPMEPPRD